jgi:hypothetical protein
MSEQHSTTKEPDMNAKRLSHAACQHPSTKVARAKCRRDLAKMVTTVVAVATVSSPMLTTPLMLMPAPAPLSRTEYCTRCDAEFETIAPESLDIDPVCYACTSHGVSVTRENWREFKGETVTIEADTFVIEAMITGWSEKILQYKTVEGKTVRLAVDRIVSVTG